MLEHVTSISYLGPAGTFTDAALHRMIADAPLPALTSVERIIPAATPQDALQQVRARAVDLALVPTENFVDGPVTTTLDALARDSRLQIYAETQEEVVFSLLVREGTSLEQVQTVGSHPIALAQIRQWLGEHAPEAEQIVFNSTAAAVEAVVAGELDAAAAPARAGEMLGLSAVAQDVADVRGAFTRFIAVGRPGVPTARTGYDRTSVVFRLLNEPGTLVQAMTEFGMRGVDLTRIESRPTREKFGTYNFYIDCVGHIDDAPVAEALAALSRRAIWMRYLGSWPAYQAAPVSESAVSAPDYAPSYQLIDDLRAGRDA